MSLNNIFILKQINSKWTQIFLILNDLLARCLSAFNVIFFKYLMEICYMNGNLIFFIIGIIQIIISLFICLIIKFTLFEFPKSLIIIIYYFFRNFFLYFSFKNLILVYMELLILVMIYIIILFIVQTKMKI